MTIRLIHSNDVTLNRADIATRYTDMFFDDEANVILLPDPTGMLELKFVKANSTPTTTTTAPAAGAPVAVGGAVNPMASPVATTTAMKGYIAAYCNAGVFLTLDNLKFSVTTTGNRGLSVATVSGTVIASISSNYSVTSGGNGLSTAWPGATITTTPSGSWFGYHFPNAGDGSTYLINDYTNQRVYRVHLMIGPGYASNFISIERLL